jgi:hypothetical protein
VSIEQQAVPDGRYLATFSDVKAMGETIVVELMVAAGTYRGRIVRLVFSSSKARKVLRESTGMYVERLSFEGDAKADKLDTAINYNETGGKFIVDVTDGSVSTPKYNAENVERLMRKIIRLSDGSQPCG